jgi:hypothetical protein
MVLAEARVLGRYWASLAIATTATVCMLVPEVIMTRAFGLTGTAVAWAVGTTAAALATFFIRRRDLRLDRLPPPWIESEVAPDAIAT